MKKLNKRRRNESENDTKTEPEALPAVRHSDEPLPKKVINFDSKPKYFFKTSFQVKWINKQRVLVFSTRGINHRDRHLMEDLKKLMPHHKPESKMERSKTLSVVNEMCEMKNCNKAVMFEGRKKMDLYLWLSNVPNGPSVKFLVQNDNRIWFRNFQILSEDGGLAEIGPRFVLNPVKIFSGSFGGVSLWENPSYISPAKYRQQIRLSAKNKYLNRLQQKAHASANNSGDGYKLTPLDDIFEGDPLKKAHEIEKSNLENEVEGENKKTIPKRKKLTKKKK
ncbi:ribosome biogenesis protein BRX1 -like [Asbolus verrucosus]|uniref:Ribosome biogenesis protein BRX1 homolog n=1 Tax=Asbolus verrucosus TaxID=1661398 RepID=A0A482V833_ASBVE|nr:ribosome biogenesis protein BRX1 -like [Asbolus verrucosus]